MPATDMHGILSSTPNSQHLAIVQLPSAWRSSGFYAQADSGRAYASDMGDRQWLSPKPYDLRERLFKFACLVVRLVQYLHTEGPVASALSYQVLKAGTPAGANYEDADDGSSPKDAIAKKKITLRELKETRFRLRVLRRCRLLKAEHDPVLEEALELIRIVSTVIRNAGG
jgi:four helix bundle protein